MSRRGLLLATLSALALAVPPDTLWTRRFGGTQDEWGWWVEECCDSGFVLSGWTNSFPPMSMRGYVVRADSRGDELWNRVLSFSPGTVFQSYCVRQTRDSGYIVVGYTNAYSYDAVFWRLDPAGNELWSRHYGGMTAADYLFEVVETPDNGFIATGYTNDGSSYDLYLLRTDPLGAVVWERRYGRPQFDEKGEAIVSTPDGGYVVAGTMGSGIWLLRLDQNGDTVWTRGFGSGFSVASALVSTLDSGFVFAGYVARGLYSDGYIVRLRANGDTVWTRQVGTYELEEQFSSVGLTADGGFVCGGWHYPHPNDINIWLVRFNTAGDTLWTASYGTDSGYDYCYSAPVVSTGGCILCGRTDWQTAGRNDIWLVRVGAGSAQSEPMAPAPPAARPATVVRDAVNLPAGAGSMLLFDVCGRRVTELPAENRVTAPAPGVYFCRQSHSAAAKTVIVR